MSQYSIKIAGATANKTVEAHRFDSDDTFMYFYDNENEVVYARQKGSIVSVQKTS